MTICTASLPTTLEVPPMRLIKPRHGDTRHVTTRVKAEGLWVVGCILSGSVAQILSNFATRA